MRDKHAASSVLRVTNCESISWHGSDRLEAQKSVTGYVQSIAEIDVRWLRRRGLRGEKARQTLSAQMVAAHCRHCLACRWRILSFRGENALPSAQV